MLAPQHIFVFATACSPIENSLLGCAVLCCCVSLLWIVTAHCSRHASLSSLNDQPTGFWTMTNEAVRKTLRVSAVSFCCCKLRVPSVCLAGYVVVPTALFVPAAVCLSDPAVRVHTCHLPVPAVCLIPLSVHNPAVCVIVLSVQASYRLCVPASIFVLSVDPSHVCLLLLQAQMAFPPCTLLALQFPENHS